MRTSILTHRHQHEQHQHQRGSFGKRYETTPLAPPTVRQFRLGKPLPEVAEQSYGQILARKTTLPRKLRLQKTSFWVWLPVIFAASLIGFCFFWYWWGTWPR